MSQLNDLLSKYSELFIEGYQGMKGLGPRHYLIKTDHKQDMFILIT